MTASASAAPFVRVSASLSATQATVLTADALALLADLHRQFEPTRQSLLAAQRERQLERADVETHDAIGARAARGVAARAAGR